MRRALWGMLAVAALWACGGATFQGESDAGGDGGSSGSGSGSSSGGSSSSGGGSSSGSGSSSGASSSGSGGSSSSSGSGSSSGSSSGGVAPVNHRPDDSQCLTQAPPGDCTFGGSSGGPNCSSDAQCVDAGVNGRCVTNNGGAAFCYCTSDSCADDGACPTGQTCACHGSPYTGGVGNHCVPGNCRVDADCGVGGWCSPTYTTSGCGSVGGYYCHTPQDQCVNDSDCADAGSFYVCAFETNIGYWSCVMQALCATPQR